MKNLPAAIEHMLRSVTSVFSQADGLQAAMSADGQLELVLTGPGRFQAHLTQVVLQRVRLADVEESLPCIAFITAPEDTVLIALSVGNGPTLVWRGIGAREAELMMLGPGRQVRATGVRSAFLWRTSLAQVER